MNFVNNIVDYTKRMLIIFFISVLPKFSVSISGPKFILPNIKAIGVSIRARYDNVLFVLHRSKGPLFFCFFSSHYILTTK